MHVQYCNGTVTLLAWAGKLHFVLTLGFLFLFLFSELKSDRTGDLQFFVFVLFVLLCFGFLSLGELNVPRKPTE